MAKPKKPPAAANRPQTPSRSRTPEKVLVQGLDGVHALHYKGQPCSVCGQAIKLNSLFRARAGHKVEFWKCMACGAYGFEKDGSIL